MLSNNDSCDVIVIGGGPAGLMAAGTAGSLGAKVILLEKNSRCGLKLLITGAGKCNITNSAQKDLFLDKFLANRKFLYPSFNEFFVGELVDFFEQKNVILKTEPNGKMFPVTDKSLTILEAFLYYCSENNVQVITSHPALLIENIKKPAFSNPIPADEMLIERNEMLSDIEKDLYEEQAFTWKITTSDCEFFSKSLIIATGGLSYTNTGATGDGYKFARDLSHNIIPTRPALVPFVTAESWSHKLSGISVKNALITLYEKVPNNTPSKITVNQGDLLFTHFGVSGPPILLISRNIPDNVQLTKSDRSFFLLVDLTPEKSLQEIHKILLKSFDNSPLRQLKTVLNKDLGIPLALSSAIIEKLNIDTEITGQKVTKTVRSLIVNNIKSLEFKIIETQGYIEAMVTAGGISTKEINPATMESKLNPSLYFCGEIIDIDADTGGYNLQAAISTGYLAGKSASKLC